MNIKAWIEAFRLRTLPLSLSCILMGTFLASGDGFFRLDIFLLSTSTTILLQVLSNLANDYGDSIHGADSNHREGPARAVQTGAITKSQMKKAIILFSVLALITGCLLLFITFRDRLLYLLLFLAMGLLAIFAAINYTAGKKPYGYKGLGDLAVFIFFGLVGVGGVYFLQAGVYNFFILLPAASCGLFATGVLNVNNIRDIESDKLAGKISIPVRLGRERAIFYHWALLTIGYSASCLFVLLNYHSLWQWLFLITLPLFVLNARAVYTKKTAIEIDPYLKQLSIATLLFVISFGVGLLLAY
ncbi:1,4-dihydroxy-2-naphthoate polyprenyltransferase [Reichenbachiella sp. MALMAid0571]|uniref:1,4-dihydroxy-2-naphthoate polyprenyltransferase n=1 Tax=Reichenbachiella sp. MALMAid0571 TaxID=3143939 RepID=UPI0032DF64A4